MAPSQTLADAERKLNPATLYSRVKKLGIRPRRQADGGRIGVSVGKAERLRVSYDWLRRAISDPRLP